MNTLIRHIEYLVSRHGCVIVPELGAFIGTHVSARYDTDKQMFMPPHRLISFNGELKYNDGLIASSIQRAEGISYEAALKRVKAAVDTLYMMLNTQGTVAIGALGTLTLHKDSSTISFERADTDIISVGTLWLPAIAVEQEAEKAPIVVEAPIQRQRYWTLGRVARTAAAIALLIGIGFVASTPIAIDQAAQERMLASLAPAVTPLAESDILPSASTDIEEIKTPESTEQMAEQEAEGTESTEVNASDDKNDLSGKDIITDISDKDFRTVYYVVVATLANQEQVEQFLGMNGNDSLMVIKKGRYYRVYASQHTSIEEAHASKRAIADRYPDAWIFEVKK